MPRILMFVIPIAIWVYGVVDCAMTPERKMPRGLSKPVWLIVIMLVPVLGSILWLVVKAYAASSGHPPRQPRRKGPTAPDEDPEFLANLDWMARKAHHERIKREKEERRAREAAAEEPEPGQESGPGKEPSSGPTPPPA